MSLVLLPCMLQSAFGFGLPERYEYELSWAGITVGVSSLEARRTIGNNIIIESTADSIGWVSSLYYVEDRVESIIKSDLPLRPISYNIKTIEGSRKKHEEVLFDLDKSRALYRNRLEGREEEFEMPPKVLDPLSSLYAVRGAELKVGQSFFVKLFDSEKVYDLEVQVLKRERITVPAGTFDTIMIKPILQSEGIFSRKGPIYTWLSDDDRRMPVMLRTKVAIGSITAELKNVMYEGMVNGISSAKNRGGRELQVHDGGPESKQE